MSQMKDWFLELIESGEFEYLEKIGAPKWAIIEAKRFARFLDQEDPSGEI